MSEDVLTIGPLEPGLYVIECEVDLTQAMAEAMHERLKEIAPECRFIILGRGARIARMHEDE